MDIDTPAPAEAGSFSLIFPLPFRILTLISLGILAWSTNLHGISAAGIDTAQVLDVRLDDYEQAGSGGGGALGLLPRHSPGMELNLAGSSGGRKSGGFGFVHPTKLYQPVYQLFLSYAGWTFSGWLLFRYFTAGSPVLVQQWTYFPFIWACIAIFLTVSPWTSLHRQERWMAMKSLKRTVLDGLFAPVPFSDVLLADVMTSFAKVFGDVWVSGCLVLAAESGLASQVADVGCYKEFMVPLMTSLPYLFRLRQCLAEYFGHHTATPRRSLLNALKYASAFPVIILSALQSVYGDPFHEVAESSGSSSRADAEDSLIGRHALFQIWVLAVLVNSLYSFWWDVTNDWGLSLLTSEGWTGETFRLIRINTITCETSVSAFWDHTTAKSPPSTPFNGSLGPSVGHPTSRPISPLPRSFGPAPGPHNPGNYGHGYLPTCAAASC